MITQIRKVAILLLSSIIIAFFTGCYDKNVSKKTELIIFVASSLSDAINEIALEYEEKNKDVDIKLSFASSGTLQKQIEEGAPADIFISAGVKQMDTLEDKNLLDNDSRRDLLKNRLVVIVGQSAESKINDMDDLINPDVTRISIGTPETVPAGKYAKDSLVNTNLWERIQDKLVFGKNVRQVLSYVETANVDVGIVYESDTKVMKKSITKLIIPEDMHSQIAYPLAIIKESHNKEEGNEFIKFLLCDDSAKVFIKNGFTIITNSSLED